MGLEAQAPKVSQSPSEADPASTNVCSVSSARMNETVSDGDG
jgi:hypothetical protein